MNLRLPHLRLPALALLTGLATLAPARAQENFELGRMWTFERPPLDYLEEEYGFRPTQEWLDFVRSASLRFGDGCSASFVSPHGLILTNHHCVRGNIAENQGDEDWVKNGFTAPDLDGEVRLAGLTVQQLVSTREVTEAIEADITDSTAAADAARMREQNRAKVLADAEREQGELEHEIVDLFQGAIRMLYSYKIYDDVRLVNAPHLQAAHFGGDFDNFTYPRYCTDYAFCRAYENGEPAETQRFFFRWRMGGAKENELVFITGNPGTTKRLMTKAQFEYQRDGYFPWVRELVDNRLEIMKGFAARSPQLEKALRTNILSFENTQKAFRGMHEGLLDPAFMALKERAEGQFRTRITTNPDLNAEYGALWGDMAEVADRKTALEFPLRFHSEGGSTILMRAVKAVQAARADSEEERARLLAEAQQIPASTNPVNDAINNAFFVDHLTRAVGKMPEDDEFLSELMQGRTPEATAEALAQSEARDDEFLAEIANGGPEAVASSDDLAIRAAQVLAPLKAAHAEADAELTAREEALGARIGRALFAAYGTQVSPDATFTLRFSDGRVKGYDYNGTKAPWHTTFYGLYARAEEFGFEYPWDLPEAWRRAAPRIDMTAALDFVATTDSTGGNSGSPMIDQQGRLVGLLFDGNIESLPNDFLFRDVDERSVMVHVDGILEALTKVYDAGRIAAELLGASRIPNAAVGGSGSGGN